MSSINQLLQPSLGQTRSHAALYSTRAQFFVAFLGNAAAVLLFAWQNTKQLGRQRQDAWLYVLGALVVLGWTSGMRELIRDESIPSWLASFAEPTWVVAYTGRIISFGLFLAFYVRHRGALSAAEIMAVEPRRPWLGGGLCILGGLLINYVVLVVLRLIRLLST